MKLITLLSLTILSIASFAQENYTISGNLKDSETGEDIIGARILVEELPGTGAITNVYGFYALSLPTDCQGKHQYHILIDRILQEGLSHMLFWSGLKHSQLSLGCCTTKPYKSLLKTK